MHRSPAVEETHISVLFLVGDRVYKLKKPLLLPFLDWRERAAREATCHLEVDLNRRLAPDVYLGVVDLVQDGEVCDHLVAMRRMPADRRLRSLVERGEDVRPGLDALADLLVGFHARAVRSADVERWTRTEAVLANWDDNLALLAAHPGIVDADLVARVRELAHGYLRARWPLFELRRQRGLHVDGHGDLLADDIYLLDDGPRVLDCLEFSASLRAVDVLDDVAFLAMDLERLGAPALADHFVAAYVERSGERHPPSLLHHYIAYRAGVRSKVACLRADQGDDGAAAAARALLAMSYRHLHAGRVRLVLVGGLPGTGKSSIATRVAAAEGWPLLRSDEIRKRMVGVEPTTSMAASYGEGIYDEWHTDATYRAMLDEARRLLALGESVVLDATWRDPAHRRAAGAVAAETGAELVALRCAAPVALAADRVRSRPPGDPSDATPDVVQAMAVDDRDWPEATVLDTTRPLDDTVEAGRAAVRGGSKVPGDC